MADERREIIVLDLRIDDANLHQKIASNTIEVTKMKDELKVLKAEGEKALKEGMGASAAESFAKVAKLESGIRELNGETKRFKSTIDESNKATNAQVGSYEQLYRQWKLAEVELKNMDGAMKRNADGTFSLTEKYHEQSAAVKQAKDALIGFNKGILDGRLNVGNYDNSIVGLEQKLSDLNEKFRMIDTASPEFEATRDAIAETKLEIDQLSGKVDEFGNREPKNLTKKGFEDATDAANGLVGAFTLLQLLKGKDGETSEAAATAMKAMAIATAAANVVKGYQGLIDTVNAIKKKLLADAIVAETAATETQVVATEGATVAQEGLNVAMSANPIGAVIIAIVALGAALYALNAYMTGSSDANEKLADENERLTKTLTEQNRIYDNQIKQDEAHLNLMKAQGASAEEIRAQEEKINAEKIQTLKNNIAIIQSNIDLDKSKIADVQANDSLYESYLKMDLALENFFGRTEEAEKVEAKIAQNKKERAEEFQNDLKVQEDAMADASAALENAQADQITQEKEHDKTVIDAAQKRKDDLVKVQNDLIDSQNRLISDARTAELTATITDFNRKLETIKGNSQVENKLRASLKEEQKQKEQQINDKYDALEVTERLKAKETELNLELQSMREASANKLAVQLELLDLQKQEELQSKELSEADKANIEEKYRQAKVNAEKEMNAKINADFYKSQQDKLQAELIGLQVAHEDTSAKLVELAALRRDQVLNDVNATNEQKLLAEARYNQEVQAIMMAQIQFIKQHYETQKAIIGNVASSIGSVLSIMGANQDQMNEFLKASAIAQLGVDTAKAISATIAAASSIPFPANLLAITAGIATVLKNISMAKQYIDGTATPDAPSIQGFAEGGLSGTRIMTHHGKPANGPRGDNRLAYVRTGEVVLNEQQQEKLGGDKTFAAIGVPGFSGGGFMQTINSFTSSITPYIPSYAGGGLNLQEFTAPIDQSNLLSTVLNTVDALARRPSFVRVTDILGMMDSESIRVGRADA